MEFRLVLFRSADITWRAGIDVLAFGVTKVGAVGAEAILFFDPARGADFVYRRKRAGHLLSRMRFVAAQFEAVLADDLWPRLAGHPQTMAAGRKSGGWGKSGHVRRSLGGG